MKKIIILGVGVIAFILSVISPVYGAYSFPTSINTYATFSNLYSNHWAVLLVKTPLGTYSTNKDLYMYIHSPIPGDLVSIKQGSLNSTVTFYNSSNQIVETLNFNDFSGGDLIAGWYKVSASNIPSDATQFSFTIMSLSTSLWPSPTLLEFNNLSYYAYTDDLQLTMFFEDSVNQAYNDGFNHGYDIGYDNGYNVGYDDGYSIQQGDLDSAYDRGYDDGYNNGIAVEQLDIWSALWMAFTTPFTLFEIEMLPGITIGMIALIPLVLGLIAFIFSLGGKKK